MTKLGAAILAWVLGSSTAFAFAACGGASESGLFGEGPTLPGSDPDAGVASPAANSDGGSGALPGRGGAPDASLGPADGAPGDAALLPVDARADRPPPTADPGVQCGVDPCKVPADLCCRSGTAGQERFACAASGGAACLLPDDLQIPCDDARDCATLGRPGSVCCAQESIPAGAQTPTVTSVSCRSPGSCSGNGRRVVCDTLPGACPVGTVCAATATFPGFNLCQ